MCMIQCKYDDHVIKVTENAANNSHYTDLQHFKSNIAYKIYFRNLKP